MTPELDKKMPEDVPSKEPKPGSLEHAHARISALEHWARHPGAIFGQMAPTMAAGGKMTAFYKNPDGEFLKYFMDPIDYHFAFNREPGLWSAVPPPEGAKIVDMSLTIPHDKPHHAADQRNHPEVKK